MFELGLFTGGFIHFLLEENYTWCGICLGLIILSAYGLKK